MFNLNFAIAEWRRKMKAAGIKSPAVLDELESHLREDVERLVRSGREPGEAFETAVRNIGRSDLLRAEFAKAGGHKEIRVGRVIGTACCIAAGLYSMVLAPNLLFIPELGSGQRTLGVLAFALTLLFLASLRFSYKFLPVIRNRRVRTAVVTTCGAAGMVWLLIFVNILPNIMGPRLVTVVTISDPGSSNIEPTSGFGYGGMIVHNTASPVSRYHAPYLKFKPSRRDDMNGVFNMGLALIWAMTFATLLGGVAYGLDEAARRRTTEDTYV